MLLQYFDSLEQGISAKLEAEPESSSPRKIYALELARLGKELYSGERPVAWCGVTAPFDLLRAMGITSCYIEFVGAMLASVGAVAPFLQLAEDAGYGADSCGYHRSVLGAARREMMPVPEFLVATSAPCTAGMAAVEELARYWNKPLFVLHVPQTATPENVAYLAGRIKEMVRFVEGVTGRALDPERLRDTVEKINRARELMAQVYTHARHVPSPVGGKTLKNFAFVQPLLMGTDAAIDVAGAFARDLEGKVMRGESGVPGEKLRLLWVQNRIQYKHPLIDMLENDHGAAVVVDELNEISWDPIDPQDPFTGMAARAISLPLNGPIAVRVERMKKLAREYRVDGAINPCHWGCRQGTGARGLVQQGLAEVGIPVLNLETDCADPRNFSEGQARTRLEAFLEMLHERRSSLREA